MVTLRCSVKVGRPYGRSKKLTLSDMMSSLWTANLLRSKTSMLLVAVPLWLIWSINALRIIGYFVASERASRINQENLRLVTDYMRYEHELSDAQMGTDPVTMRGYKYLVYGEDKQERRVGTPKFRFRLDVEHERLLTAEGVWSLHDDQLLGAQADAQNRFKDVCLSFALYKLLRRRFHNLPSHEDAQDKTRQLILNGVLQGAGSDKGSSSSERAFRITEIELSFLRDSFHGNHAVMFVNGFPSRRLLLSVVLVSALSFLAYPVYYIPRRSTNAANLEAVVTRGVPVTFSILFLIILKEFWEIYVYVFSQWTMAWMLCEYIMSPKLQCSLMRGVVRLMHRLITRGRWDQQVGQYNLLIQCPMLKLYLSILRPTTVKLQTHVMKAVLETLKDLQSPQSLSSYFPNAFGSNRAAIERFSWANEFEADTHRILVWHLATCLCEIQLCGNTAASLKPFWLRPRLFVHRWRSSISEAMWGDYVVSVTLSNYCAYLLTGVPRLVPDNGLVSRKVFYVVRHEVYSATLRCRSLQDIHKRLVGKPASTDGKHEATVKMGAELARQLLETYTEDNAWQILSKFWRGFLLHLAASTKAERHKTRLQGPGELITHLWALLYHAGFHGTSSDEQTSDTEIDLD